MLVEVNKSYIHPHPHPTLKQHQTKRRRRGGEGGGRGKDKKKALLSLLVYIWPLTHKIYAPCNPDVIPIAGVIRSGQDLASLASSHLQQYRLASWCRARDVHRPGEDRFSPEFHNLRDTATVGGKLLASVSGALPPNSAILDYVRKGALDVHLLKKKNTRD